MTRARGVIVVAAVALAIAASLAVAMTASRFTESTDAAYGAAATPVDEVQAIDQLMDCVFNAEAGKTCEVEEGRLVALRGREGP